MYGHTSCVATASVCRGKAAPSKHAREEVRDLLQNTSLLLSRGCSQEPGNTAQREAGRAQAVEVQSRISLPDCCHHLRINELGNTRYTKSPLESTSIHGKRVFRVEEERGADVSEYLQIVNYSYPLMEREKSSVSSSASAHTESAVKNHQRCETAVSQCERPRLNTPLTQQS